MTEEWKEVDDYPDYYVSNYGNVWSKKSGKMLKQAIDKDGYKIVTLYRDGEYKKRKVHRLVASAFLSSSIDGKQINHIDENPANNRLDNIEICDASYNINYGNRNKKVSEANKTNGKILRKPVEAVNSAFEVEMRFDSMHDAERAGYNRAAIYMVCNNYGRLKTYKGFIWRYAQ